jgi:hypothetical protein
MRGGRGIGRLGQWSVASGQWLVKIPRFAPVRVDWRYEGQQVPCAPSARFGMTMRLVRALSLGLRVQRELGDCGRALVLLDTGHWTLDTFLGH